MRIRDIVKFIKAEENGEDYNEYGFENDGIFYSAEKVGEKYIFWKSIFDKDLNEDRYLKTVGEYKFREQFLKSSHGEDFIKVKYTKNI